LDEELLNRFEKEKKELNSQIELQANQQYDSNLKIDNLTLENQGLLEKVKMLQSQVNSIGSESKLKGMGEEGNEMALLEQIRQLRGMVSSMSEEEDQKRDDFIQKEKKLNSLQTELSKEKFKVLNLGKEINELKELNKEIMSRNQEIPYTVPGKQDNSAKIGEIKKLRDSIRQSNAPMQRGTENPTFRASTRASLFNSTDK
jgi:chromosome segregation ATPase